MVEGERKPKGQSLRKHLFVQIGVTIRLNRSFERKYERTNNEHTAVSE